VTVTDPERRERGVRKSGNMTGMSRMTGPGHLGAPVITGTGGQTGRRGKVTEMTGEVIETREDPTEMREDLVKMRGDLKEKTGVVTEMTEDMRRTTEDRHPTSMTTGTVVRRSMN